MFVYYLEGQSPYAKTDIVTVKYFENFFSEYIKNAENKLFIATQKSVVNVLFLLSCLAEHPPPRWFSTLVFIQKFYTDLM